jgi:hypothetical protein
MTKAYWFDEHEIARHTVSKMSLVTGCKFPCYVKIFRIRELYLDNLCRQVNEHEIKTSDQRSIFLIL